MADKKARNFSIQDMVAQAKKHTKGADTDYNVVVNDEEDDENEIELPKDSVTQQNKPESDNDDEEGEEDEKQLGVKDRNKLPKSQFATLEQGSKTVTALDFDHSGNRMATGSIDFEVKLWDFSGMDDKFECFRSLEPVGNNQVTSLSYNCTGEYILVTSGSAQAYVMDRDGHELVECIKGDQYIVDATRTMGHLAFLNEGCWSPRNKAEFMTCSNDSTVRIWDTETASKKHKDLIKIKNKTGAKTTPTGCTFDKQHGNIIACICQDGSVQMWDKRKKLVNSVLAIREAHLNCSDSTLTFSYDNDAIATRSTDDTLKLWDLRCLRNTNPSKHVTHPLKAWDHLFNRFPMTNAIFSPNDKIICTATSFDSRAKTSGKLVFVSRDDSQSNHPNEKEADFEPPSPIDTHKFIEEMELSPLFNKLDPALKKASKFDSDKKRAESVGLIGGVRVAWHPRLNQIALTCSDGRVRIFYDPDISFKGVLQCVGLHRETRQDIFKSNEPFIIVPDALPMFKENMAKNSFVANMISRRNPLKSHRPDLPLDGSGMGGRIAETGGTLHSFVIKNIALAKPVDDKKDPREAILKYAKEAAEDPYWTKAYKRTQPHAIFDNEPEQEELPPKLPREDDKRMKFF